MGGGPGGVKKGPFWGVRRVSSRGSSLQVVLFRSSYGSKDKLNIKQGESLKIKFNYIIVRSVVFVGYPDHLDKTTCRLDPLDETLWTPD